MEKKDIIEPENGVMRINADNLSRYLEEYGCKDANDLSDTLWYDYGIYCEIV